MDTQEAAYWENRYREGTTGWDIGSASLPLQTYFDQLKRNDLKVLIPGGGNGYETEYLFRKGFGEVYLLDFAETPLAAFKMRVPDFPEDHLIFEDFFKHEGQYDLIIEQTFFSAIHPSLREDYLLQMNKLLKPGGKLTGLLFNENFDQQGPPFGGTITEYRKAFEKTFRLIRFEPCYNSIAPRSGREIFMICLKPNEQI